MLSLLLQAAQQAQQVAPNVYVTVQQPPAGMPEWVKIVISAAVGAVFAIGGSMLMELMKPKIAKVSSRKEVKTQLVIEVKRNLEQLNKASKVMSEAREGKRHDAYGAVYYLRNIWNDRYLYYLQNQPIYVFELDRLKLLKSFYQISMVELEQAITQGEVDSDFSGPSSAGELMSHAINIGSNFVGSLKWPPGKE